MADETNHAENEAQHARDEVTPAPPAASRWAPPAGPPQPASSVPGAPDASAPPTLPPASWAAHAGPAQQPTWTAPTALPATERTVETGAPDSPPTHHVVRPTLQAGVPQTGVPQDAAQSGGAVRQTGVPQVGVPQTGVPQTGVPQGGVPQTGVPQGGVPQTGVPQVGVAQTGVPQVGVPQTGVPQVGVAQTGVPQVGVPQTSVPQVGVPQTSVPQVGVAQTGVPQGNVAQDAAPSWGVAPQAGVPQVDVAQTGVPQGNVAQDAAPSWGVTQAGVTQAGVPQAGVPQAGVPQTSVPQPSVAQLALVEEFKRTFSRRGWQGPAIILGVIAATALVLALATFFGAVLRATGSAMGVDASASIIAVLWGVMLAGGVDVSAGYAGTSFGGANLTIVSVTMLVAVPVLAAVVTRLRTRATGEQSATAGTGAVLLRSAIEGALVAIALTIISAFVRASIDLPVLGSAISGEASLPLWRVFLGVLLGVTVGSFASRRGRALIATWGGFGTALRESATYVGFGLAAFIPVAIVGLVLAGIGSEAPEGALLALPFAGNVAGYLFGLSQFGRLSYGMTGTPSVGAYMWDIARDAWYVPVILVIVLLLAVIVAAVQIGVRRPRTAGFVASRIWQLPVGVFLIFGVIAMFVLPISASGGAAIFEGAASAGPSWETPFLVALVALGASALAEVAPLAVYRLNPGMLAFLGGRHAATAWVNGTVAVPSAARPFASPTTANAMAGSSAAPATAQTAPVSPLNAPVTPQTAPGAPATFATSHAQTGDPMIEPGQTAPTEPLPPHLLAPAAPLEAKPMSRRAKKRLALSLGLAGGALVLAIGAVATVTVLNGMRDPSAAVSEYLALLEKGDGDAATALVNPGIKNDQRVLLTSAALGAQDVTHIKVLEVTTESRSAEGARVTATFSLDGATFTHDFLVKPGPKEFLLLDTWKVTDALIVPVGVSSDTATSLTVGDVTVKLTDGGSSDQLYAYPGIYPVKPLGTGTYFEGETASLEVTPDSSSGFVSVALTPTAALQDLVLAEVEKALTACVSIPTNMDDMCPSSVQDTQLSAMSVTKVPKEFQSFDSGEFQTDEATISTTANPTTWVPKPKPRATSFTVHGTYEVEGETVKVTIDRMSW